MDKYSYRFAVASLCIAITMLTLGVVILLSQDKDIPAQLTAIIGGLVTGLGFLLVPTPRGGA